MISVHKDPTCGCCSGWVEHLQKAGFITKVFDTKDIDAVKKRLGVPDDLAACHTAEVAGYVIEGHVPAAALTRFLAEKPHAKGLAVPGMPVGSPGMEGDNAEPYEVVLFGPAGRRSYMRFLGAKALGRKSIVSRPPARNNYSTTDSGRLSRHKPDVGSHPVCKAHRDRRSGSVRNARQGCANSENIWRIGGPLSSLDTYAPKRYEPLRAGR